MAKKNGQSFHNVYGGNPTQMKENFKRALEEAKTSLKPGEPLIIQFTGHGFTSDPRDPKLSGVSTGNQQIVNYDTFTKMIQQYAGDTTVKLVSSSCFGGGVHYISRELNKAKPGSACSISATSHATPANVRNQTDEPTQFTQNLWNVVEESPNSSMSKVFSNAHVNTKGKHSFNDGFTSLGSTDAVEFYNNTGSHSTAFKNEWAGLMGTSDKPWTPPRGITTYKIYSEYAVKSSNMNRIFDEEFGELQGHADNQFTRIFNLPSKEAKKWYEKLKNKEHGRKTKEEYVPYIGELIGWKWDVDAGVEVKDQYPKDMLKWKLDMEKTITEYGKKKMELFDNCIIEHFDEKKSDHSTKTCESGFSYIGDNEGKKSHNENLSKLEKEYRKKIDDLKNLKNYPKLAEMKYLNGETEKMKKVFKAYNKTSSPLRIEIDPDKYDGVQSFIGNYVDLDLYFKKACKSEKGCAGKVLHFNGVHPATVKVPNYIF